MNEFEDRWRQAVKAARSQAQESPDAVPFGFATRVVAQWQARPEASLVALWQSIAVRVLATMAVVLLSLLVYGAVTFNRDTALQPPVENAVADSFWLL